MQIKGIEEHDVTVDRSMLTFKYHVQSNCHYVPNRKYTQLMTKYIVEDAIYLLVVFRNNNGVSNIIGPSVIVLGRPQLDFNIRMIAFGAY